MSIQRTLLKVRVNPRSSRNQITGWQGDVLGVKVTAPAVEGAANKACIEFLADQLGVKKSHVTLVTGAASREKVFEITGISREDIHRHLAGHSDS
ncbi:MAG TPA: DUF167 domain-containing protein [Armatimonadota bacterium]|nr:DUF167 domain-containing protein [Armatimonadota bacterium]